ncbi:hypothetical protein [Natrinema pallidum]|uniref:Uncharacterized protein n=1 Tax=Natrinema pallidum TaxID=69527 RepID=A0A4P9TI69_9EURY|nr:hypothetical protein [Natrinema pallidum]QCW03825.1 hypothetical protein FGF80_11520 [Natrinema pallidum]
MDSAESTGGDEPPQGNGTRFAVVFKTILGAFGLCIGFVFTVGSGLSAGGTIHTLFLLFGLLLFFSSAYVLYCTGIQVTRSHSSLVLGLPSSDPT